MIVKKIKEAKQTVFDVMLFICLFESGIRVFEGIKAFLCF